MLNLAGQIAIVAAIDLACAQALAHIFGGGPALSYGLFVAIVALHGGLNATSVRLVARLNDLSGLARKILYECLNVHPETSCFGIWSVRRRTRRTFGQACKFLGILSEPALPCAYAPNL